MGYRHPNPRLAKIHRSYSVEDMSRLFKIHKNTVRNWLRQGLTAIDDQRPTVIRGDELRRFLTDRRARAKQTCGPGRIYCLPCRAPKVPAGKMAECIDDRRHHWHASRHLPGLRPHDLPPGQSAEAQRGARRPGHHGHTSGTTHRRDDEAQREL